MHALELGAANSMTRRALTHEEIQAAELDILSAFEEFSSNHKIRYTLLYGTLIGAIRHKGFIPWDDDIDVGVPRPEYQWLIDNRALLEAETGYSLVPFRGLPWSDTLICKLVDKDIAVEERGGTEPENLWIDIFPIDSLPDDAIRAKALCRRIKRKRIIFVALTSPISSAVTMKRRVAKALLKLFGLFTTPERLAKEITAMARSTEYGSTDYVNALTWTNFGFEGRFHLSQLSEMQYEIFEGKPYPVMKNPEVNLRGVYGDFMDIPDESKRETHSLKAWRAG